MEWEFELDLKTEGGLELSNRLKKEEITLTFGIDIYLLCNDYPLINEQSSLETVPTEEGYIVATKFNAIIIVFTKVNGSLSSAQKIGQMISLEGMSKSNLKEIAQGDSINLVLAYEEPDTPKIAEINKKIIIIMIIGSSILIILLIIKFIFK